MKQNTLASVYTLLISWFLSLENSVFEYKVERCVFTPSAM